ncbi:uncharacterized protein LOC135195541 isoform X2 [Macrobrachium nipponense]|uniref:uncharacterized protein LOC135195541 isoform X2 n=1 Tax=Macrobrachium nipponense TaxID=159736 RepID=UPI0030C8C7C1
MASANKRTTCALATVAIIFIIVIIILCLVPDPCRRHDPRPECKAAKHLPYEGDFTDQQTTSTASPSTTVRTTSTTRKQTEPPTTSPHPPTSTSTFSPSTSSVSSTWSTEESLLEQDTYGTDSSTYSTESSHFTDEDGTTTPVSDLPETTIVVEAFDNETTTTDSFNMTTEFGGESTTEMYALDYNVTEGDSTTEMYVLDYNVTEGDSTTEMYALDYNVTEGDSKTEMYVLDYNITTTDVISTTLELNTTANVTEMPTTTEIEMSTGVSTTETAETTTETELSTTMTAGVTNATDSSTTTVESTTEAHLYPVSLQPPAAPKGVCDTEVCTEVARRMLDMMDPGDVDPCDDFYQYSCGGVLDDPFLKPEDPQVFADKIIKEALTYGPKDDEDLENLFVTYDSCLNYSNYNEDERFTSAREVFEELGYQFSPLPGSEFDVGEALLKMMKRHFTPFFDINIDIPQDEETISLKMVLPTAASAFTNERAKDICVAEYKAKEEEAKYNKLPFDVNSQYEHYVNCTKHGQGLQERMKHIQRSIDHLGLLDDKGNAISEDVKNQATGALKKMLEDLAEATPSISEIRKALVNKIYEEFSLVDIDDNLVLGHLPPTFQSLVSSSGLQHRSNNN